MHTSKWHHVNQKRKNFTKSICFVITGELLNTFVAGERDGRVKPKRRFSLRESNNRGARTLVDFIDSLIGFPLNFRFFIYPAPIEGQN